VRTHELLDCTADIGFLGTASTLRPLVDELDAVGTGVLDHGSPSLANEERHAPEVVGRTGRSLRWRTCLASSHGRAFLHCLTWRSIRLIRGSVGGLVILERASGLLRGIVQFHADVLLKILERPSRCHAHEDKHHRAGAQTNRQTTSHVYCPFVLNLKQRFERECSLHV
jgi:hypothetical protein